MKRNRLLTEDQPGNIAFSVDAMFEVATMDLLAEHLPISMLMRPIRAAAERFGWTEKSVSEAEIDKDLEALINPSTSPPPALQIPSPNTGKGSSQPLPPKGRRKKK